MKKRTLDEYRQTKEYKLEALEELHQKLWGESYADDPSEYDGDTERDHIEEAKIEIVDKVTKHFQDLLFEMICEEMSNRFVFQSGNYLTEAGFELFEEKFFEFYHEHHGEILCKVMKNIQNG